LPEEKGKKREAKISSSGKKVKNSIIAGGTKVKDIFGDLPTFTFKESLFVARGFGAMSASSIGREEASHIGSSRASAE
jgi:hypothetical protein